MGRFTEVVDGVAVLALPNKPHLVRCTELVGEVVAAHYRGDPPQGVPREVLVPDLRRGMDLLGEWLSRERGTGVRIRVPQRGDKRSLQETVTRNAAEEFMRHRLKRAADHNSRARGPQRVAAGARAA